jgi:superfamily II DNA or RNA helicase
VERPISITSARELKELIAMAYLVQAEGENEPQISDSGDLLRRLGAVTLHPHQRSAARRLRAAINEFGGALLSDEVGMGKTFVALALARKFRRCIIVGPATLRDMWSEQAWRTGMQIPFLSFEALSRGHRTDGPFDLVIIDEAHHLRNRSTARYRHLSRIVMRSNVLMLTATPIHNTRRDLDALLALFLGSRAESLTRSEIARCIVRRQVESAGLSNRIPPAEALIWKEIEDDDVIPGELLSLPAPVPVRGGGDGGVLVARSLLRQWCSSDAALASALRRRLGRSIALSDALESGRYPSEQELSAWSLAEDSIQLAFPSLVASPVGDGAALLATLRVHADALRRILSLIGNRHRRDAARAEIIRQIRGAHPGVPVVAFSQYAETVRALFREFRTERGVAVLTASGAGVAGGAITRREALARFAPMASHAKPPRSIDRIDLLLATDLLSEGVNLQDAGVVVHLDLPWTAARLEQRMGRVRRLGSVHRRVHAYAIRPSTAAESLIRLEDTIRTKIHETEQSVGGSRPLLPAEELSRCEPGNLCDPITAIERIRSILNDWGAVTSPQIDDRRELTKNAIHVAATLSTRSGFLALCAHGSALTLLTSQEGGLSDGPNEILEALLSMDGEAARPESSTVAEAQERLHSWFRMMGTIGPTERRAAGVARSRRKVLRRISASVQNARPHTRQRLMNLAERAREAVLGRLGAAAESGLLDLVSSDMAEEEWLRAIVQHAESGDDSDARAVDDYRRAPRWRVIAILLLVGSEARNVTRQCGDSRKGTLTGF